MTAPYERVPEAVHALVGLRVGEARRPQEGRPYGGGRAVVLPYGPGDVVAVRRVIDQCHAPARLLEAHEPVVAGLELGVLQLVFVWVGR